MTKIELHPEKEETTTAVQPWSVKAITWLLLVEMTALTGVAVYRFSLVDVDVTATVTQLLLLAWDILVGGAAFSALALLTALAIIGFLRLWSGGWAYAMLLQGLLLALMLVEHFREPFFYTHPLMLYGIILVVYLYHPDVQAAFHVKPALNDEEEP